MLHHARGMLRFGEGRFDEALAEFARAQGLERLLAGEHVFTVDVRGRALQVRVRMGDTESARARARRSERRNSATAPGCASRSRLWSSNKDDPEGAIEALAPVIDGSAPALYERWARAEALLLARHGPRSARRPARGGGVARGGARARRAGRPDPALHALAEPASCSSATRRHRTAHATFISTILDTLAGRAAPQRGPAAPLRDELSEAELRVVRYLPSNLTASEIASELVVSTNTVRTHMRHIYAKLDAHTRSEAVARARELGLVAPERCGAEASPPGSTSSARARARSGRRSTSARAPRRSSLIDRNR